MASSIQRCAQDQLMQYQQLQQHNHQSPQSDSTSSFSPVGSVPSPLHRSQQSQESGPYGGLPVTYVSPDPFHEQQHPFAAGTQLPTLPPQLVVKVNPQVTVLSTLPYVVPEADTTLNAGLVEISDEAVKRTQQRVMEDMCVGPLEQGGKGWYAIEGLEEQGKPQCRDVDDPIYAGQQGEPATDDARKKRAGSSAFKVSVRSPCLKGEARYSASGQEAILPEDCTVLDSEDLKQLIPVCIELEFGNYRLRRTFVWNANGNDRVVSPEIFAATACLDFNIPLSAGPSIVTQIQNQLVEYLVQWEERVCAPPTESSKKQPLSNTDRAKRDAEGHDGIWWGEWRKRLGTVEVGGFLGRVHGAGDEYLKHGLGIIDVGTADIPSLPNKELRILIKLDITMGSIHLVDQFEWDFSGDLNSPENFAECYTGQVGLAGEFKTAIAHAIRQQVEIYTQSLSSVGHWFKENTIQDGGLRQALLAPAITVAEKHDEVAESIPILEGPGQEINCRVKEHQTDVKMNPQTTIACGVTEFTWEPVKTNTTLPACADNGHLTTPVVQQAELLLGGADDLVAQEDDGACVAPQSKTLNHESYLSARPLHVAQHNVEHQNTGSLPCLPLSGAQEQKPYLPPSTEVRAPPKLLNPLEHTESGPMGWQHMTCGPIGTAIAQSRELESDKLKHGLCAKNCGDEVADAPHPSHYLGPNMEFKIPQNQSSALGTGSLTKNVTPGTASLCGSGDGNSEDKTKSLHSQATALWSRFTEEGNPKDLDDAIMYYHQVLDLHPPSHPDQSLWLTNLADALETRFEHHGDLEDLDKAIMYHQQAVDLNSPAYLSHSSSLSNLACTLQTRFMQRRDLGDLGKAIMYHQQALDLHPPGHTNYPSYLSNLANALQTQFMQKRDLGDLDRAIMCQQQALNLHSPGQPDHSSYLSELALGLQLRFNQTGDLGDLDKAIMYHQQALDLRPPHHPGHSSSLHSLAGALRARFRQQGDLGDLEKAITYHQQVLDLHPPSHPLHSSSLDSLSSAFQTQFKQKGDLRDLDKAIMFNQQALDLQPPGHPLYSSSLDNMASALVTRFKQKGDLADLEKAITYHQQAFDMCPTGGPDRTAILGNLAIGLHTRFKQTGDIGDLEKAIMYHQQVLDLRPPGHPDHSVCLNNLANALHTQFDQKGDLRDLDKAIIYRQQALNLRPIGHPLHRSSLSNLAGGLQTRFNQTGDLEDLGKVIIYLQQALDLYPPGHRGCSSSLGNLANALQIRFGRVGDPRDQTQAIMYHQKALDMHPLGHPQRSASLANLAGCLEAKFKSKGNLGDLDRAIMYHQQALDLRPPGHPHHSVSLRNLGIALRTWFGKNGDHGDLNKAIVYHQKALDLCPPGNPDHASSLSNLAGALVTQFRQKGDLRDLDNAISLYKGSHAVPYHHPSQLHLALGLARAYLLHPNAQENLDASFLLYKKAANHIPGGSKAQLGASIGWIDAAKQHLHHSELLAYITSLGLLQKYLALIPAIQSRLSALSQGPLSLGSNAAACAVRENQLGTAIELLEQGRAVLWRAVGGYRTSLEELQDAGHQKLAEEFQRQSHILEHSALSSVEPSQQLGKFQGGQADRYHQLARQWDGVIEQIRGVEGFSNFLKATPFPTLQLSTSRGPVIVVNISQYQSDAIILSDGQDPILVHLPSATLKAILHLSTTLKKTLKKVPQDKDSSAHAKGVLAVIRSLWYWVVEPIVAHLNWLPKHSHIWWCPTSALCALPLHAAGPWERGKLNLPDMFLSSYTPTLSALQRAQASNHTTNATPTFLAIGVSELAGGLRKLESVKEDLYEMTQVAASKGQHVDVLEGENACRDTVLAGLQQHSWVHFACHGHQDFKRPFKSSFHLYDMPLSVHDIIQAKIPNAELAFLSACHSASADQVAPDEIIHLAGALQFSGFKTVIGTLWAMDDRDGPDVARGFYEYMFRNGKEKVDHRDAAEALKHVVDTLRRKQVSVDRWACFVHIGA